MKLFVLLCFAATIPAQNVATILLDDSIAKASLAGTLASWPFVVKICEDNDDVRESHCRLGTVIKDDVVLLDRYPVPALAALLSIFRGGRLLSNVTKIVSYHDDSNRDRFTQNMLRTGELGLVFMGNTLHGIHPVEMNEDPACPAVHDVCTTVHGDGGEFQPSQTYKLVRVTIVSNNDCSKYYTHMSRKIICAKEKNYFGRLQPGAPLMCTCKGKLVQAGIGAPPTEIYPGKNTFTRITSFASWIDDNTNSHH